MIHVLTVHWKDDRWVDIQLAYLKRHCSAPFRVYAFLNDVPGDHRGKYFYSSTENITSHAIKLNLLADMVALSSGPDDWLMFLDGDAFPVTDVAAYGAEKLQAYPLVAIQRAENHGDIQPHPSFCLTTVGFWKAIGGDWKEGYRWKDRSGALVTDVGGNLLGILQEKNVDWFPMRRSNKLDLHPLWFGLYDDVIYHHGAGFRDPFARVDSVLSPAMRSLVPQALHKVFRRIKARFGPSRRRILRRNRAVSEEVFRCIGEDPLFYRRFQEPAALGRPGVVSVQP